MRWVDQTVPIAGGAAGANRPVQLARFHVRAGAA
jgi:hypothetical protein